MIPEQMTAIAVEGGKGPAEALHPVRIATPHPAADQILIRVKAAGSIDRTWLSGWGDIRRRRALRAPWDWKSPAKSPPSGRG
jgi:hypothetical protein